MKKVISEIFNLKDSLMDSKTKFLELRDSTDLFTPEHEASLKVLREIGAMYDELNRELNKINTNDDDPFKI